MKGGQTPIHIQRWAPADYQHDEHVQVLLARRDWMTLTFYRQFLDASFLAGGDLPADPEALAACVRMPAKDVRKALSFCVGRLLREQQGRLYQKRVRGEVAAELEFRERQAVVGAKGGRPKRERVAEGKPNASLFDTKTPPSPSPSPTPYADASTCGESVQDPVPPQVDPGDNGNRGHGDGHDHGPEDDGLASGDPQPEVDEQRPDASGVLEALKLRLSGVLNRQSHATWIRPLERAAWWGDTLVIEAPSVQFRDWIKGNYATQIKAELAALGHEDARVRLVVRAREPAALHNGAL